MSRIVRYIVVLLVGLALLAFSASLIVSKTIQNWSERDVALRADLVLASARKSIITVWQGGGRQEMITVLTDITRDERIMGAAACRSDWSPFAVTPNYPILFACSEIARMIRSALHNSPESSQPWGTTLNMPGGSVHISTFPIADGKTQLGFIVLLHDMSFAERREATTHRFLIVGFAFLALAASILTIAVFRFSWRGWNREVKRYLSGTVYKPEFHPLLKDFRELIEQISTEREGESHQGAWTPQRLQHTLSRYLHGKRIITVSNREPYIHERMENGEIKVLHPASGVVTALEPVMRACSGIWVAHGSGSADRDVVDKNGRVQVPPGENSYMLRRVWLTPEEERGYYYGFANEGFWPLCHVAHNRPIFRNEDWKHYQAVNIKFADAVCAEADSEEPVILVQDYHLALAPAIIRERLPRAIILTFWHIPWPNSERFGICPWREELIVGLLGSSILGFHTQFHCNNFLDSVDTYLEARIDRERVGVVYQKQSTLVRAYPISIEWPIHWLKELPAVEECRASLFAELGLQSDARLGIGVDRLDYTKGIEDRLLAVERLLERFPAWVGRFTFVQLAAPSRTIIEHYRLLNERVENLANRINERFGNGTYRPIIIRRTHHEPPVVMGYYRAADLCYVSSLHDGMNLVAKEFVAAREDERGVLVLSQFTGAARELTEALIVNPYDLEESSSALAAALNLPVQEQQARMRAMRSLLSHFNVYRWAGRMLIDASYLRRRNRITDSFFSWPSSLASKGGIS